MAVRAVRWVKLGNFYSCDPHCSPTVAKQSCCYVTPLYWCEQITSLWSQVCAYWDFTQELVQSGCQLETSIFYDGHAQGRSERPCLSSRLSAWTRQITGQQLVFGSVATAALFFLTLDLLTSNYNSVRAVASLEMTMQPVPVGVGTGPTLGAGVLVVFFSSSMTRTRW